MRDPRLLQSQLVKYIDFQESFDWSGILLIKMWHGTLGWVPTAMVKRATTRGEQPEKRYLTPLFYAHRYIFRLLYFSLFHWLLNRGAGKIGQYFCRQMNNAALFHWLLNRGAGNLSQYFCRQMNNAAIFSRYLAPGKYCDNIPLVGVKFLKLPKKFQKQP